MENGTKDGRKHGPEAEGRNSGVEKEDFKHQNRGVNEWRLYCIFLMIIDKKIKSII